MKNLIYSLNQTILKEKNIRLQIRVILGAVFILAGVLKLADSTELRNNLANLALFPSIFITPFIYLLIMFEITAGIHLIFKYNKKVLLLVMGALCVFCIYLGYKVFTHDAGSCGCLGKALFQSNSQALVQDVFLLIGGIYLYE